MILIWENVNCRGAQIQSVWAKYSWVISMQLDSCQSIGAENFEMFSRFLENVWTHVLFYLLIYFLLPNQE